ncbi:MAG: hypothetical protein ACRDLB_08050 [Actinomycetota bacterium]
MKKMVAPALLVAVVIGGCTSGSEPRAAGPRVRVDSPPTASPEGAAERPPLERKGVRVENVAFGASHRHANRAIKDLKKIGLWGRLTDHLYVVKIGSRLGRGSVPEDGHLADAFLTAQVDEDGSGALCDIRFYPTAMIDDLERWAQYYAQNLLPDPAPTLRDFWGTILAHELAHCLGHGKGEEAAERWEDRALRGLQHT